MCLLNHIRPFYFVERLKSVLQYFIYFKHIMNDNNLFDLQFT